MSLIDPVKRLYAKVRRNASQLRLRTATRGRILPGRCGYFGNMFMTLNGIRTCEAAGVEPEPYWNQDSLFHDPQRGDNAWLYYYKPVVASEAQIDARVVSFLPTAEEIHPVYPGMGVRRSYYECIRRFVHFRDEIQAELDALVHDLFGSDHVLGVHIRQTDALVGFEARKTTELDIYCGAIDSYVALHPACKVFAATDSAPVLELLRKRYGDRIIALDVIRSKDNTSIHGHYDGGVEGSPYQKGLDVIRDAHLLSHVHHLIRGNSRVTAYSLCANPTLTFTDIAEPGDVKAQVSHSLPWLNETA